VKVLAIRLGRFGDLVLLLPALALLKARLPKSHLTLLTDTRWAPLAKMCPAIDDIIAVDRIEMRDAPPWCSIPGIIRLMSDVRRRRFDAAIDCHGFRETSLLAWWSRAPQRWGLKRFDQSFLGFCFNRPPVVEDKSLHASASFFRLVDHFAPSHGSENSLPPLVVPGDALQWASERLPKGPFAVLFVDAPVPERVWPLDRFGAVADHITGNLRIAVVVVGNKNQGLRGFGKDTPVFSGLSIPHLAALIAKASLLVSNDTGPMHLGPALGVPTVGIFSVGIPTHFRPTGSEDRYVQGDPIDTVGVDEVVGAVSQVWKSTDPRNLRR